MKNTCLNGSESFFVRKNPSGVFRASKKWPIVSIFCEQDKSDLAGFENISEIFSCIIKQDSRGKQEKSANQAKRVFWASGSVCLAQKLLENAATAIMTKGWYLKPLLKNRSKDEEERGRFFAA